LEAWQRQRGAECCEQTSTTRETNRFWLRLGGSAASRTCCSFSAPVAPRRAFLRASRDVRFCAIAGNFNFTTGAIAFSMSFNQRLTLERLAQEASAPACIARLRMRSSVKPSLRCGHVVSLRHE